MVPLQQWEQWLKKQIIRNWVKKQILHFARTNLHWEKYFCRFKERETALRKSYGRKKSGFSSDRSKHRAVKSWHCQRGCPIVFSVKAEPVARPCHCTLFIFLFCEKTFVHLCLCGSIFSFLSAVSSFSTLSTYCYWCGLEAACLCFLSSWLTHSGQLKCFPIFFDFALCLWKPSCLQGATHSFDDLQYQIQADAFIIALNMCVGVVWWFVVLGFFSLFCLPGHSANPLNVCFLPYHLFRSSWSLPSPSSELSLIIANTVSNLVISVSHWLAMSF